jgi:hypothetical protein
MPSNPTNPPPNPRRLRHWAARLSLLVACIATVATSKPISPPVTSEYAGQTRLTAGSPRATRQLFLRASARNAPNTVLGEAVVELIPRWQSSGATPASRPTLRVRWGDPDDPSSLGTTHELTAPGGQGGVISSATSLENSDCRLDEGCEWTKVLDLEVQGVLGEDVVEVDWKVRALVEAYDTSEKPDGFRLEIWEP